jgi:cellulose synthase/poly-beta-1,6-N-acetylglucosamine synthase-like glycosyltransferase
MAFTWLRISTAKLASGEIVEDLKLGLDLARAGAPPLFCADALVTSDFPNSSDGIQGQRTRWEHGHLRLLVTEVPRLLASSVSRQGNVNLLALALDLSVPPLALLSLLVTAVWCAGAILYVYTKAALPLRIASADIVLLVLAVFMSWHRYGRQAITLGKLALAAFYALWKIPLYTRFLFARQVSWVRSKRNDE